jgi:Fe-S-cluster containining protein
MVEQISNKAPTAEQQRSASARREAFIAAIPKSMLIAEDRLPAEVAATNASSRSKLRRIYEVVDELSRVREAFVACTKGCASCCHMNVTITSTEADRLGKAIGRPPVVVRHPIQRSIDHFAGQPCTFLGERGECSVYAHRPLACRKHASYFEDESACHPEVMNRIEVPQVEFSGLDQALFLVSVVRREVILADIRDFFPTQS